MQNQLNNIQRDDYNLFIYNPSTRIWNGLPFSKRKGHCGWQAWYSFGYGESSDDYKVVEMSSRLVDEFDRTDIIIRVQIYSVKTRNWKRLGYCSHDIQSIATGVYSNGALHWTAFENRWSSLKHRIASLDLEKEIYGEALQPKYDEGNGEFSESFDIYGCN
ncbi:F-box associated domain containing protein [Tanacetum coccineum]